MLDKVLKQILRGFSDAIHGSFLKAFFKKFKKEPLEEFLPREFSGIFGRTDEGNFEGISTGINGGFK